MTQRHVRRDDHVDGRSTSRARPTGRAGGRPPGRGRQAKRTEGKRPRPEGGKDARDMRICVPRDGMRLIGIPIRAPGIGKRTGDKRSKGKSGGLEKGSLSCW